MLQFRFTKVYNLGDFAFLQGHIDNEISFWKQKNNTFEVFYYIRLLNVSKRVQNAILSTSFPEINNLMLQNS